MYAWDNGMSPADLITVNVAVTAGPLVAGSEKRRALIVGCSNAGRITIAPGTGVVLDQGINIPNSVLPLVMTYEQWGELVRRPWSVIGAVAGTIGVGEVLYG